jgi:DNA-binding LytR/AlgR family response regulator
VKPILALLALLLLAAAARPISSGPLMHCRDGPSAGCAPARLKTLDLDRPAYLERVITIDPAALPLPRPPMVWIIALGSSEVRWNGVVIGRNGVPAIDRAGETPGLYITTFQVPMRLVRPGENRLSVYLSGNHLWLPVRAPIHFLDVSLYETPFLPGLSDYLPALLMLGAFLTALVYFGASALSERSGRDSRGAGLIAIASAATVAQLLTEVSRAFINYTYPWHLARVTAVALFASVTAVAIANYAARRFAPSWQRRVTAATASACLLSLVFMPWYDLKAIGAILAGVLALLVCAVRGLRDRRPYARLAVVAVLAFFAVMGWELTGFLDRGYYLVLAPLLIALVAEQVASLRRARAERDRETARATALAERLARAEREGEPIVALKDGSRTHRVAESDILYVRAADDYCDVALADGRTLLVTATLARLLSSLPSRFERVHKSYAVNRSHVVGAAPRPGGGKLLSLSEGSAIPVGRSYEKAVASWLEGSNPPPAWPGLNPKPSPSAG